MKKQTTNLNSFLRGTQKIFNKWVVLEGCRETTGTLLMCRCFTCGRLTRRGRALHAGHYLSDSHNKTRFWPGNVHPQCYRCNKIMHGNSDIYRLKLREKYGEENVEYLEACSRMSKDWTLDELKIIRDAYRARIKELEAKDKKYKP